MATNVTAMVGELPHDTRGIVDPAAMMRHVEFARSPAGQELDGIVEWFWSVRWDLPPGAIHDQQVLNHPAGNLSIGTLDDTGIPLDPPRGRAYGVATGLGLRRLSMQGWTVAARSTVGGLGVLLDAPAKSATDDTWPLARLPGLDGPAVVTAVAEADTNEVRTELLRDALSTMVAGRDQQRLGEARDVVEVAALAEHDRSVRRPEQLASAAGVSLRTLQRQFDVHVGVSPSFVIRRWRIIEAAEAARAAIDADRQWRGWAAVAAELGYADQAHLTRDFGRHLGISPAAYLSRATPN